MFLFYRHTFLIEPDFDTPVFKNTLLQISRDQQAFEQSLKTDATTTVSVLKLKNTRYVVKRYNTKNKWHFLRRLLRQSRAENCWKMSAIFAQSGIQTPQRVASIQEKLGPFKLRSWFINEYIDAEDLLAHLIKPSTPLTDLEMGQLQKQVNALFRAFSRHQLSHGDMKATNILFKQGELCLIDLDAAKKHTRHSSFARSHQKDWARFLKNWQAHPKIFRMFKSKLIQQKPD